MQCNTLLSIIRGQIRVLDDEIRLEVLCGDILEILPYLAGFFTTGGESTFNQGCKY